MVDFFCLLKQFYHTARPEEAGRARRSGTRGDGRGVIGSVRSAGVADWNTTGKLHEHVHEGGLGTRSVRSPLRRAMRRAPLLATPIATPLQGGCPERPGPFRFNFSLPRTATPSDGQSAGNPKVASSRRACA